MKTFLLFIGLVSLCLPAVFGRAEQVVVIVPVSDVWSRPLGTGETPANELRETQVLFGEKVLIHESSGPWVRIEAVEQPEFTHHHRWEGYPGWVQKAALGPDGIVNRPKGSPSPDRVIQYATSALGTPYLWGGLTPKGFDCSGLVHRAYREAGQIISRDAHEQWMKAKPIKRAELKPGDLIFSAKADQPKMVAHVALFVGWIAPHPTFGRPLPQGEGGRQPGVRQEGQIIEAPQTGMVVRKISFQEKYGKPLDQVESGDRVGERVVYFGSFLHDGSPASNRGG